jgi:hypothetical protein
MKITLFFLTAIAALGVLVSCGGNTQTTPTEMGDKLNIPVKIALGDIFSGATEITILSVVKGTLKEAVDNLNITSGKNSFKAGDPCIIITAEFKNTTSHNTQAVVRTEGFDADGIQRSWILETGGPILGGPAYRNIAALSTTKVMVIGSWAENLAEIKFSAYIRNPQ